MKSLSLVALLAALMMLLVAAQSGPVVWANPTNSNALDAQALPPSGAPVKFAKAVNYGAGGAVYIAMGDVNGDGHQDIVGAASESVFVLLGKGDGSFQPPASYGSGGVNASAIALGDVNGDGHPDIVVANYCESSSNCDGVTGPGGVSVLLGNADGTFQSPASYSSGGYLARSVAIADLNGDGRLDIAVANYCQSSSDCNGNVSVLRGNGDGTFQPPVSYDSGGYEANAVAVADLNGDGKLDLVVANCGSTNSGECDDGATVSVLLGNGDGTFQSPVNYVSGQYGATSVAIGDLNGDGHPDLAVTYYSDSVSVFLNNGDGTFRSPVTYASGGYSASSVAIRDLNGDGKPDLAVTNLQWNPQDTKSGEVGVFSGNGDGTFQAPIRYAPGGYFTASVAVGDLNGDGRDDIVVTNPSTATAAVLLNELRVTTTTRVSSSPNPSLVNQSVTFSATVTATSSVPNGSAVTFYNGVTKIGTATTTNGVAALTTSFNAAKTYTIKATYSGDAFHKVSSGTVKQVVNP